MTEKEKTDREFIIECLEYTISLKRPITLNVTDQRRALKALKEKAKDE